MGGSIPLWELVSGELHLRPHSRSATRPSLYANDEEVQVRLVGVRLNPYLMVVDRSGQSYQDEDDLAGSYRKCMGVPFFGRIRRWAEIHRI